MTVKKVTVTRWECTCDRRTCGHQWQTKTDQLPKVCPVCKQPTWNRPRRTKKEEYFETEDEKVYFFEPLGKVISVEDMQKIVDANKKLVKGAKDDER